MSKIKICGLSRLDDVKYVNQAKPDYAGFIINFPKSHRSIDVDQLKELKQHLKQEITAVGVFVNQPVELVAGIAQGNLIDMIQLHGEEDESYIRRLRIHTNKPIIQAFRVRTLADIAYAEQSMADHILLDAGQGEGQTFDWQLLKHAKRPYFLAGGINRENITEAIDNNQPYAIDVSSGAETNQKKDQRKIFELVQAVRSK